MTSTVSVLGLEIPQAGLAFYALLAVHVPAGLTAATTGAIAALVAEGKPPARPLRSALLLGYKHRVCRDAAQTPERRKTIVRAAAIRTPKTLLCPCARVWGSPRAQARMHSVEPRSRAGPQQRSPPGACTRVKRQRSQDGDKGIGHGAHVRSRERRCGVRGEGNGRGTEPPKSRLQEHDVHRPTVGG